MDDRPAPRCARSTGWHWLNVRTGEIAPGRCKASWCPDCGPYEALMRARIISDGGRSGPPQRYIVLSSPPERWRTEFQELRQKMRDFKRIMAKRHGEYEHAWTVERGPKNGMLHVNVLQKGTFIPQPELQKTWGGIAHVKRIRAAEGVGRYALKEAMHVAGYAVKEAHRNVDEHLTLNGGRLVHLSRGYLGGETMSDVRSRLTHDPESEPGEWVRLHDFVPG